MKKIVSPYCVLITVLLLFSGCNQNPLTKEQKAYEAALAADESEMYERFGKIVSDLEKQTNNGPVAAAVLSKYDNKDKNDSSETEIRLPEIFNSALLMSVKNNEETNRRITEMLSRYDAVLQSSEERFSDFRKENTLLIRVSPEKSKELADKIRELAAVLREKKEWKEDLASRYFDLTADFENKIEQKEKLKASLKSIKNETELEQAKAAVSKLDSELEQLKESAKLQRQKKAQSIICITLFEEKIMTAAPETASFDAQMAFAATDGWDYFKNALLWAAGNWPFIALTSLFILPIILAIFAGRRRSKKFRKEALKQKPWALNQDEPSVHEQYIIKKMS